MNKALHIGSYFSLPTDLAGEMRSWPEFVGGEGYSVDLRNPQTGEAVTVRYVEVDEVPWLIVDSPAAGGLFDRVVGRTVEALSHNSDSVWVERHV
jgi:hypothetical protein